eukprot:6862408-Pyramimonas_sp.AAC.3
MATLGRPSARGSVSVSERLRANEKSRERKVDLCDFSGGCGCVFHVSRVVRLVRRESIPVRPASGWSIVSIYLRVLRPIGPMRYALFRRAASD